MKPCTEKAEARFESQYGIRRSAEVAIVASTPLEMAGLQAVDYCLVFERPSDSTDGWQACPHRTALYNGWQKVGCGAGQAAIVIPYIFWIHLACERHLD